MPILAKLLAEGPSVGSVQAPVHRQSLFSVCATLRVPSPGDAKLHNGPHPLNKSFLRGWENCGPLPGGSNALALADSRHDFVNRLVHGGLTVRFDPAGPSGGCDALASRLTSSPDGDDVLSDDMLCGAVVRVEDELLAARSLQLEPMHVPRTLL